MVVETFGRQISPIGSTMGSHQDFREVIQLLWAVKLRPSIDPVVPLAGGARPMNSWNAERISERSC